MSGSVNVTTASEVFAAIPHLLGFVPRRSFVLVVVGSDPLRPGRVEFAASASLEVFDQDAAAVARKLTRSVMDRPVREVIGLAVCASFPGTNSALPYRTGVLALAQEIRQLGFSVGEVGHVLDFSEGSVWRSYLDTERSGHLPDPFATPVAATAVAAGIVTARSRDDLVNAFTPAAATDRVRLEPHIVSALEQSHADRFPPDAARDRLARADSAVTAAAHGVLPTEDTEIADLIATFSVEPFRSAAFSVDSTDLLLGVETLATYLWRFAPEPCASHLAAVAALHAYLLGSGTRANVAIEAGRALLPLLSLLRQVLDTQLPPHELQAVTSRGAAEARADLTSPKPTGCRESAALPADPGGSNEKPDRLGPEDQ